MVASFFSKLFGKPIDLDSVRAELHRLEREIREKFSPEDFKNGDWFLKNLRRFIERYKTIEKIAALEKSYPSLDEAGLADILIRETVRSSTIVGSLSGAAISTAELSGFLTWGLSLTVGAATALAEMLYQVNLQLQLTFDLAAIYNLVISTDEPEEMLVVFTNALGIDMLDLHGDGNHSELKMLTQGAGANQIFKIVASRVGCKLVQLTASKYLMPVVNIGVGAYASRSMAMRVGRIAKERFGKIQRMKERLFMLQSRIGGQQKEILAAVLNVFQSDGALTLEEINLLREMALSIQASALWRQIMLGDTDIESDSAAFITKFQDPKRFEERELLLNVLQIASEAKLSPNLKESEFLRRLMTL